MRPIRTRGVGFAAAALTLAILAAACGSGGGSYGSSGPSKASPSPQPASSSAAGALNVEQVDYRFQPMTLRAKSGSGVTVELVNHGGTAHTFTIDELSVDKRLDPGQSATVTFTPTTGGTFTFYCRFHRSSGMTGSLTVSDGPTGSSSRTPSAVPSAASSGGYRSGY